MFSYWNFRFDQKGDEGNKQSQEREKDIERWDDSDSEFEPDPEETSTHHIYSLEKRTQAVEFYYKKYPRRTLEQMQHNFSKIRSISTVKRWAKSLRTGNLVWIYCRNIPNDQFISLIVIIHNIKAARSEIRWEL